MEMLDCSCASRKIATTTCFRKVGDSYVIIEHVPCMVCDECGEIYHKASAIERIDEIVSTLDSSHKVSIVDFATSTSSAYLAEDRAVI